MPQSQNEISLACGGPEDENEAPLDRPRVNQPLTPPLLALRPQIRPAICLTRTTPFRHYLRRLFQSGQTDEQDHLRPDLMSLHLPLYNSPSRPSPVTVVERTTSNIIYTKNAQVARKETSICVYDAIARDVAVIDGADLVHPRIRPFNE